MNMMTELKDLRHGGVLRAKMRIAGELVGGDRTLDVRNPYTGSVVGTVPKATVEEIRRAFAIAKGYKPTLTRHDRYRILYRAAEIIRDRTDEISDLITAECGLCKKDSLYEVGRACDVFVFAGNGRPSLFPGGRRLIDIGAKALPVRGRQAESQPSKQRAELVQPAERPAREPAEEGQHAPYNERIAELLNNLQGDAAAVDRPRVPGMQRKPRLNKFC